MHAAQITEYGQAPKYVEVETPKVPPPDDDHVQIKVIAAGLHPTVRSRASGKHYANLPLPNTPGIDGVGTTPDGQKVFFSSVATGGSFAEVINRPKNAVFPLPDGVDPLQVAAFLNPALSSWMGLKTRVENLPANFTVLIMGATSASGRIAISVARILGAGKVIGCARNVDAMAGLELDERIQLRDSVEETDFSSTLGDVDVDVVLDYVYGPVTVHLLSSLPCRRPVQYVHIGCLSGVTDIALPGSLLRSKKLTIRGSGNGSWDMKQLARTAPDLLAAFLKIKPDKVNVVPLSEVESHWNDAGERTVFVP